jgi:hypothetical protein
MTGRIATCVSRIFEEAPLPTIRSTERRWRRAGALAGVVAMLICSAPNAAADPPPPGGGGVLEAPTLSYRDLTGNQTVPFYGASATAEMSFPVPPGLLPVAVNTMVDLPFNIRSGTLTVMQDDRVIAKLGLPVTDMAPVVIPLPGVQVVDDRVTLSMQLNAAAEEGYCLDPINAIEFVNSAVVFAGSEAPPTTIADFLPAILRKITIAVPASPSESESDAAVQLAADLVFKYVSQKPQVSLVSLPPGATAIDAPSQPGERQFLIRDGDQPGLSLVNGGGGVPQLLITGPKGLLTKQAEFLTDPSIGLADSNKAVAEGLHQPPELPGDTATLADLGQTGISAVGGSPSATIILDQTRFGHPTEAYRVHVLGSYTPLPTSIGSRLTATVDGKIIDRWATEPSGVIDHWVDIPDNLVDRQTQLVINIDVAGDMGACDFFNPIALSIGGDTLVMTRAALPPIPTGLRSVPQALMPHVTVGLAPKSFVDLTRAVQIVSGLQGMSVTKLMTRVTAFDEALKGHDSAILISPNGWPDSSVTLPVSSKDRMITVTDSQGQDSVVTLTLDPAARFGSLQAVYGKDRTLLIATSTNAPNQLDELLGWLDADPKRWSQVQGSALVAFPDQEPVTVLDRDVIAGPPAAPVWDEVKKAQYKYSPAWLVAGGVVTIAIIGVAVIVLGARRERSETDHEPPPVADAQQ